MNRTAAYFRLVYILPHLRNHPTFGVNIGVEPITIETVDGRYAVDAWPVAILTAVILSGRLGLCVNTSDLLDAAVHYFSHLAGVVYSVPEYVKETKLLSTMLALEGVIKPEHHPMPVPDYGA